MQATEILGLAAVAVAAGAINAVAGGGTLLTFPTLLFFGTPPVIANATSTFALMLGNVGSVYGYRRLLERVKPWLWRFAPVSLVGSLAGGVLLTRTGNEIFGKLVPFLILFATVLFLSQGMVRKIVESRRGRGSGNSGKGEKETPSAQEQQMEPSSERETPGQMQPTGDPRRARSDAPYLAKPGANERVIRARVWGMILFQFGVSLYGGYFGAGIGILMLAALGFMGLRDIHEMNTLKTTLSALINLAASVWFVWAGLIDWPKAGVMTAGALAGYYLGSHYSQRISQQAVRRIITAIGFGLSAVTFWKQFLN